MTLESNRRAALGWVNAVRTEWGLPPLDELPKGHLGLGDDCVLGRSTPGLRYNAAPVAIDRRRRRRWPGSPRPEVGLPLEVQMFEADFERGFYPDLEASPLPSDERRRRATIYPGRPTASDSPAADRALGFHAGGGT
jgi:hypothetical protein